MRSAPPLKLYLQDVKLDLTVDLPTFATRAQDFFKNIGKKYNQTCVLERAGARANVERERESLRKCL